MKNEKSKKGYSNYTLSNPETGKTINLSCPSKLKMSFFQTMINLRYGLPPLDVNPIDWMGLVRLGVPFLMVLICAALNESPFYIILGLGLLAYNLYITYRYYLDFCIQALEQGYLPDDDLKQALEENQAMPLPENLRKNRTKIRRGVLTLVAFLIILNPVIASGGGEIVKYVKTGSFYEYPDQTIEEGVDNLFSRARWSYDGYMDGKEYVSIKGKIYYMEEKVDAMMQFEIDPEDGTFSIYALEINDIPQNQLTIYGMKTAMFE